MTRPLPDLAVASVPPGATASPTGRPLTITRTTLFDGRELIYFDERPHHDHAQSDGRPPRRRCGAVGDPL